MTDRVTIEARFNGPPRSGNGGYACGLVAAAVDAPAVRVTLAHPPPIGVALERERAADGSAVLRHGDVTIASAVPAELPLEPPEAPPLAAAQAAVDRYSGFHDHPFPTCFVCGPARGADGLRIFPGPVEGRDDGIVAAPWRPPADLVDGGAVDRTVVWAALDCPGAFACRFASPAVLGRLTARLLGAVRAGEPHIVTAWPAGRDGRKHRAGSAVHTADGTPVAVAEAVWIEVRDPAAFGAPASAG